MDPHLLEKAIDSLIAMIAAITNLRLYPPTSAIIRNSIEKAYSAIQEILSEEESVSFAESEKNLLVSGHMLSEKNQKKPQVTSMLDLMLNFGIRNITFNKGLEDSEIGILLELLSQKPEDLASSGGIQTALADKHLVHILLDHKVYVAMGKDEKIVSKDTPEDGIIKFVAGMASDSEIDLEQAGEMAKDPEWISKVLQAGLKEWKAAKQDATGAEQPSIREVIENITSLGDISDKAHITRNMAKSIAAMDNEDLNEIFIQNLDDIVDEGIFDHILDEMDDEKFQNITAQVQELSKKAGEQEEPEIADVETINRTFKKLMESGKGKKLARKGDPARQKQAGQLKAGLSSILKGDPEAFDNEALLHAIPSMVSQLFSHAKHRTAETIIDKLGEGLLLNRQDARENIATAMSAIGQQLIADQHFEILQILGRKYIKWIQYELVNIPARKNIFEQLNILIRHQIKNYAFEESSLMLEPVYRVFSGQTKKSEPIKRDCGELLMNIGTQDTLEFLLQEYRPAKENLRQQIVSLLKTLVPSAADFILDILRDSEDMNERKLLLQLYAAIGKPGYSALMERFKQDSEWYYTRNLVSLLGKIGSETDTETLRVYLSHKDFRVQREALNSINHVGGAYREKIFLDILPSADDRIKINAIAMLGHLQSLEAVKPLLELLESQQTADSQIKNLLQEKICNAFGRIGSPIPVPALEKMAENQNLDKKIKKAAQTALKLIKNDQLKPEKEVKSSGPDKQPTEKQKTTAPEKSEQDIALHLKQVEDLVGQDKKEEAVKQLSDLVTRYARAKNFKAAEMFRDKLFEVDSMALTEIIRAGEIIEEEKSVGIDQDHLDIWPELYDSLTSDEANALYYAMEEKTYEADHTIVKQGELTQHLYFITQGEIKVVYQVDEREMLLTKLGVGAIAGHDTFFSLTVSTTSLITLTAVKLACLDKAILADWKETFPALESKLNNYCLRIEKYSDILGKKGLDRRKQKRVTLSGKIVVQLLSASGAPSGKPFAGSLSDISVGGLSFYIKAPTKKTATVLLGRNIEVKFIVPINESKDKISRKATVIGAHYHLNNDYSIHIKFDELLDDHIIENTAA